MMLHYQDPAKFKTKEVFFLSLTLMGYSYFFKKKIVSLIGYLGFGRMDHLYKALGSFL